MTRQELDAYIRSLNSIGGVYDYVAAYVEHANAAHLEES